MATLKQEKNNKTKKLTKVIDEKKEMLDLYKQMFLIRQFELACGENYTKGNIRGFLHLYIGQEATAVGSISCLNDQDYIVTHYRDHGHALARGLDVNRSMAELFGKASGLSKRCSKWQSGHSRATSAFKKSASKSGEFKHNINFAPGFIHCGMRRIILA